MTRPHLRRGRAAALLLSAALALSACSSAQQEPAAEAPQTKVETAPDAPAPGSALSAPKPQSLSGWTGVDLRPDGTCRDPWVTSAVREVNGVSNTPTGRTCDTKLYGGGSWSSYPDLVGKVRTTMATCGDRWVTQAVLEVAGRLPSSSECTITRYGGGRWSSFADLKNKVTAAFSTPPAPPVQPPAPPVQPPAPPVQPPAPPVEAPPVLDEAVWQRTMSDGRHAMTLNGAGFRNVTAVLLGSTRVDRSQLEVNSRFINLVAPAGADVQRIAVVTPAGTSRTVALKNVPALPVVTGVHPDPSFNGVGRPRVQLVGTGFKDALYVYFGKTSPSITNVTPTSLTAELPEGSGTVEPKVQTRLGTSNGSLRFTFPAVHSVTQLGETYAGQPVMRITGVSLASTSRVWFGNGVSAVPAQIVRRAGDKELYVQIPNLRAGEGSGTVKPVHLVTGFGTTPTFMGTGGCPVSVNCYRYPSAGSSGSWPTMFDGKPSDAPTCAVSAGMAENAVRAVLGRTPTTAETTLARTRGCGAGLRTQAELEASLVRWLGSGEGRAQAHEMVDRAFQAAYGSSATRKLDEVFYGQTRRDEWRGSMTSAPRSYWTLANDVRRWKQTTSPTRTKYVALGDSFSSGEGAPRFYADTWEVRDSAKELLNNCHRSEHAYSVKLFEDAKIANPDLRTFDFQACSGAVLENINGGIKQYPGLSVQQQLDSVDKATAMITVGIGGNDMGFATVLAYCVFHSDCDEWFKGQANNRREDMNDNNIDVMYHRLVHFYGQLREKSGDAPIYAVSYPNLFSLEKDLSFPMWGQGSGFDKGEVAYIQGKLTKFNQTIAKAAQAAGINYVDVNTRWGKGHEYQMPDSWINEFKLWGQVTWGDGEGKYAFHPTVMGQHADYLALKDARAHLAGRNPTASTPTGVPALPNHWWTLDKMHTIGTAGCGLNPACKPLDVNEGELLVKYKERGGKLGSATINDDHHKLTLHPAPVRLVGKEPVVYYFDGLPRDTQVDQEVAKHNWCSGGIGNWRGWNFAGWPWTEGDRQYLKCGK